MSFDSHQWWRNEVVKKSDFNYTWGRMFPLFMWSEYENKILPSYCHELYSFQLKHCQQAKKKSSIRSCKLFSLNTWPFTCRRTTLLKILKTGKNRQRRYSNSYHLLWYMQGPIIQLLEWSNCPLMAWSDLWCLWHLSGELCCEEYLALEKESKTKED